MNQPIDKIQIVTIQDIIENQARLNVKLTYEVLKLAEQQSHIQSSQMELDLSN